MHSKTLMCIHGQLLKSSMENEVAELQCKLRKLEEYQVHFHKFIDIYMNKVLEHYEPHFLP